METLILFSVGLSAIAFGHLMAMRRRYMVILVLVVLAGLLYAAIHWYVGTLDGWEGLALAIYSLIAVMPLGAGLVFGAITGSLHVWWQTTRGPK